MSVIIHRHNAEISAAASHADRAAIASFVPAIGRFLRKAIMSIGRLFVLIAKAHAEARMQRANIEIEFYRNRYKHSSKNDDDLPIVR